MLSKQNIIDILYLYTCENVPVVSTNKDRDVITNHIKASNTEIYSCLRQYVNTEHKDGGAFQSGKHCGCFVTDKKYADRVEKWMIEQYINSKTNQNLIDYIDNLLNDKSNLSKVKKHNEKHEHNWDLTKSSNNESIGLIGFIMAALIFGAITYFAYTNMHSWFKWPITIFSGLATLGLILEIKDEIFRHK